MKKCPHCGVEKPFSEFMQPKNARLRSKKDGFSYECRECHNERHLKWVKTHPEKVAESSRKYRSNNPDYCLWIQARRRARAKGLPFTIKREDVIIPNFCPVLGIPLIATKVPPYDTSPSLDRFVPELGYVPGNVAVISFRANSLKRNGTLAEHRSLVAWMEEVAKKRGLQ